MATVTKSSKGGKVLVYRGYSYRFHKNGVDKKIWICTQERHHKCIGRLHTTEYVPDDGATVEVLKESNNHNHTPDPASIEKRQVLQKVIALASVSTDSTASVVATALQGTSRACIGEGALTTHFHFHIYSLHSHAQASYHKWQH